MTKIYLLPQHAKTTIILFPSVLNTLVFIKGTIQKSLLDAGINSEVYANIFSQNATLLLKTTNPEFSQQAKRPFRGQLPPLQLLSGKQTVLGIFCYSLRVIEQEGYKKQTKDCLKYCSHQFSLNLFDHHDHNKNKRLSHSLSLQLSSSGSICSSSFSVQHGKMAVNI